MLQADRTTSAGVLIGWRSSPLARLVSCAVLLSAAGCGRSGPAVQPVDGTVLLDGQALEGATVGFAPLDEKALPAVGLTRPDGRFRVTSTGGGPPEAGAVVGEYVVVVSKQEVEGTGSTVIEGDTAPGPSTTYPKQPRVTDIVPSAYGRADTSNLRATVKPGRNTFRFELESTFKAR
jgi:hypothetical protein